MTEETPQPKPEPRTLNAYRHGLTGHVRFYTPADGQAYKKHCAGYMQDVACQAMAVGIRGARFRLGLRCFFVHLVCSPTTTSKYTTRFL